MGVIRTVARTSILKPVLQKDGKTKLVEVGKTTRTEASSAPAAAKGTQVGVSINPGDTPSTAPASVVPVSKVNTYYVHLPSHDLSSIIQASSIDEAWGIFANQNGIASTDVPVRITEFVP
jgi:hypothetical protein